jgi:hypothetical protein
MAVHVFLHQDPTVPLIYEDGDRFEGDSSGALSIYGPAPAAPTTGRPANPGRTDRDKPSPSSRLIGIHARDTWLYAIPVD